MLGVGGFIDASSFSSPTVYFSCVSCQQHLVAFFFLLQSQIFCLLIRLFLFVFIIYKLFGLTLAFLSVLLLCMFMGFSVQIFPVLSYIYVITKSRYTTKCACVCIRVHVCICVSQPSAHVCVYVYIYVYVYHNQVRVSYSVLSDCL